MITKTIKEFLSAKATPIESVKNNLTLAGKLAVEAVGWHTEIMGDGFSVQLYWLPSEPKSDGCEGYFCRHLGINHYLGLIHELEVAVIEKVGELKYIWKLVRLLSVNLETKNIDMRDILKLSRATASQRLTACLLALAEVEES
jgi:hypothetical protein